MIITIYVCFAFYFPSLITISPTAELAKSLSEGIYLTTIEIVLAFGLRYTYKKKKKRFLINVSLCPSPDKFTTQNCFLKGNRITAILPFNVLSDYN